MRITIATGPMFPVPAVKGGAIPKIWQGLAESFSAKGHEVTIVAKTHQGQPHRDFINGIRYIRRGGYGQSSHIYYDLFRDFIYAMKLRPKLPSADILVTNDFWLPLLAAKKMTSGKVVVNCGRFPKNQYRLYRHTACLAAVSKAVGDAIARQTPEVADIIRVLPNPVDTLVFFPAATRTVITAKRILYVGRLHPEKGIQLLLNAFQHVLSTHPDASLRIVGPYRAEEGGGGERYFRQLKAEAQDLPVEFTGPVFDKSNLAAIYRDAGVFCYPSLAEEGEAFGVAPLEAMASGVTPIVSKLACFSDFIFDGQNGYEFDHRADNPAQILASVICKAFDEPEVLARLEKMAVETARRYDYSNVAESYLEVFRSLLKGPDTMTA